MADQQPPGAAPSDTSWADEMAEWGRLQMEVCPGCGSEVGHAVCHMTYSTWHCFGCGATIDGRVLSPRSVKRCEARHDLPAHGQHPAECRCEGRGWIEWEATDG